MKILVSACLLGINCRYDGRSSHHDLPELDKPEICIIPVCPEQLGGLPTPRSPSSIVGGNGYDVLDGKAKVITKDGQDVTENFIRGSYETLKIARELKAEACYFKDKSPSCGLHLISENTGEDLGPGVTAALLRRQNFNVIEVKAKAVPPGPTQD